MATPLTDSQIDMSKFRIQFKFNLSDNITQVRVSKRKSIISTAAESMAFVAGLSFWAKLVKYLLTVNHIGKYYDRQYKIYMYEENPDLHHLKHRSSHKQFDEKNNLLRHDQLKGGVGGTSMRSMMTMDVADSNAIEFAMRSKNRNDMQSVGQGQAPSDFEFFNKNFGNPLSDQDSNRQGQPIIIAESTNS